MSTPYSNQVVLNLTLASSFAHIDVEPIESATIVGVDTETWGNAVVAVEKFVGGDAIAFSPAVTISAMGSSSSTQGLSISEVPMLRVRVTTADTTAGLGRILVVGKEAN